MKKKHFSLKILKKINDFRKIDVFKKIDFSKKKIISKNIFLKHIFGIFFSSRHNFIGS